MTSPYGLSFFVQSMLWVLSRQSSGPIAARPKRDYSGDPQSRSPLPGQIYQ